MHAHVVLPVRSETDVLLDQVRAIDAWNRQHRATDLHLDAATSREARLDLARRHAVVARQRQAMIDWTERQLRRSDRPLRSTAAARAVVVHRNTWFREKVAAGLQEGGIAVVADLENGADAIGVAVAEQPDLLLLEDKLPMVTGLDAARAIRRYAPDTAIAVQVPHDWEIGPFLDAGAVAGFTRRVPPADIARDLLAFLPA